MLGLQYIIKVVKRIKKYKKFKIILRFYQTGQEVTLLFIRLVKFVTIETIWILDIENFISLCIRIFLTTKKDF